MSPAHFDFEIGRYETLGMTFALHRLRHDLFVPGAEVVAAVAAAGMGGCGAAPGTGRWLLVAAGGWQSWSRQTMRGELRAAGGAKS